MAPVLEPFRSPKPLRRNAADNSETMTDGSLSTWLDDIAVNPGLDDDEVILLLEAARRLRDTGHVVGSIPEGWTDPRFRP